MTTSPHSITNTFSLRNFLIFLLSLLAGLLGGGVLLLLAWLLVTNTPALSLPGGLLGDLLGITAKTPWYLTRSAGTVAYLLLAGSTIWGLLLSSKILKDTVPAALALAMHNILSWLAIAFTGVHALALLFDQYFTYTLSNLLLPFTGPYRPGWVGLGIIGLYLMVLTAASFYFRRQIGQKRWRQLHFLSFAVYLLATIHGVMAGTDSDRWGMQVLYLGSGLLVLFLSNVRLLTRKEEKRGHPARGSLSPGLTPPAAAQPPAARQSPGQRETGHITGAD